MDTVGDGEVSFDEFCLWWARESKLVKKIRKLGLKGDKEVAEELEEERLQEEEAALAAKEELVGSLFDIVDAADGDSDGKAVMEHMHLIGPASPSGSNLSQPELNKMERELDPTQLEFVKRDAFVTWMMDPQNRIALRLLKPAETNEDEDEGEQGGNKKSRKMRKMKSKDASEDAEQEAEEENADAKLWRQPEHCDIWNSIDIDGLRYVILDGFLEALCSSGVGKLTKLSKTETANALEALDPEGTEDVTIESFAKWIASSDKAAQKVLNRVAKQAKKEAKNKDAATDPAVMRTERIKALFAAMDRHGKECIPVQAFDQLGTELGEEVVISKGEISRVAAQLDPDETGEIDLETFTEWMLDKSSESFATVRKLYAPEVLELIDREIQEEAAAAALEAGEEGAGTKDAAAIDMKKLPFLTDEEAKALFSMLDEEDTGTLHRLDFLNMGEAIGFDFAEHHLDEAMLEIEKFPRDGAEEATTEEVAEEFEQAKALEADRAKLLVHDEVNAWILQRSDDLADSQNLLGKKVRVWRLGQYQVGIIVEFKGNKAALDFNPDAIVSSSSASEEPGAESTPQKKEEEQDTPKKKEKRMKNVKMKLETKHKVKQLCIYGHRASSGRYF